MTSDGQDYIYSGYSYEAGNSRIGMLIKVAVHRSATAEQSCGRTVATRRYLGVAADKNYLH